MFIFSILLSILIFFSYGSNLPSSFKKCNRKQPNLNKCLLEAAQNGIRNPHLKSLNLININPLEVSKLDVGGAGAVAVEQHFENCKIFGLQTIKFRALDLDLDKHTLRVKGVFPEVKKMCHYRLNGQVLVLPIRGEGPSTVIFYNAVFEGLFVLEESKKEDKTFVKVMPSESNLEPGLVHFNFENLFNGDKKLGDNINRVLNDNWKELFDDIKGSYSVIIGELAGAILNSFFSKFSLEELLD